MKVLNLQCARQHGFEGWFASEDDYASQQARGLLSCPLCGDMQIQKMLSAPRLNLSTSRESSRLSVTAEAETGVNTHVGSNQAAPAKQLQAQLLKAMRQVIANTEDVGDRFADQARAMHHGDMAPSNIRGRTTPEVAMELVDEGIDVVPLPDILALNETLQ